MRRTILTIVALSLAASAIAQSKQACPLPAGLDKAKKYSDVIEALGNGGFLQPVVPPGGYDDDDTGDRHCEEDARICSILPALIHCREDRPEKIPAQKGFCLLRFIKPDMSMTVVELNSRTDFRKGLNQIEPTPEKVTDYLDTVKWFPIGVTCVPPQPQNRRR